MNKLLENKNFIRIWASQLLSQITVNLVNFLIILRIYETTHSGVMVALVFFFWTIPAIILGPFSGAIVDLVDKRKILLYTNLTQAIIILFYLGVENRVWPIYSVIFLYSLINQFYVPAESSSLPVLVKKEFYPVANSIFMFTANVTFLISYTLAGPIIRLFGKQLPYLIGSLALLVATYAVFKLPVNYSVKIKKITKWEDFFDHLKEGYFFIKDNKFILFPVILIALSQIVVSLMIVIVPLYAEKILRVDLRDSALILVTPAGLGALVGVQLAVRFLKKGIRKNKVIFYGLLMGALGFYLLSLLIPSLEGVRTIATFITVFFMGTSFAFLFIPAQTLIQEKTPKDLMGRTFSILNFMITLSSLVPLLITATLADILGVRWILFLLAGVVSVITLYAYNYQKMNYNNHAA